jgi:hypothetical protein
MEEFLIGSGLGASLPLSKCCLELCGGELGGVRDDKDTEDEGTEEKAIIVGE